jgi:uncharacterized damage-inducible protein DinB
MNGSIEKIAKQYRLTTDWFLSALENISEEDGRKTINDNSNSLEWIVGHLITTRYRNMLRVGLQIEPYKHLDKFISQTIPPPNAIKFDKANNYPSLAESREQWLHYDRLFSQRLQVIDESTLNTELPFTVLTGGNKVEDALTFMTMHESYHIGQMSIIRKALGYPAMQLTPKN